MSDFDALDERVRAVERALSDDGTDLTDLRTAAELTREVESLRERLDDIEGRLDELDAATQALRGYVGNVRAVNDAVERRADAALATAEAVEAELAEADLASETETRGPVDGRCQCTCHCPESGERDGTDRTDGRREATDDGLFARIAEAL